MKIITTSWDDGYKMDFKVAELLLKYNLQGTFYIPQNNAERRVMTETEIEKLSGMFEVGGHTLDHVRLDVNNKAFIRQQVEGSFMWLKKLLGHDPYSFCFVKGKFNKSSIAAVFNAGYRIARTTELLNTTSVYSDRLMPTTLQVYEHKTFTLMRHLIIRKKWLSIVKWLQTSSLNNLLKLTEAYIKHIANYGGCFHLWGHSWEIEDCKLWKKLEEIFRLISNLSEFKYVQNKDLLVENNIRYA